MEVRGVYLFDRRLRRVTRFNLAVKEKRSIGGATPGLDGVAKLRLNIKPHRVLRPSPRGHARCRSARPAVCGSTCCGSNADAQGFRIFHDRQWFVTSHERETTTLRRVDRGDVLAQCTITSLPAKSAGRQTTLEEFERDIRYSLRENFGQLVSSRQWTNAFKHHCLEVVVRGTAEEVPVEWHYYLVAPESGNRVCVAVTIDGQMVQRLASADRALVNAIQLVPVAGRVATAAGRPSERARWSCRCGEPEGEAPAELTRVWLGRSLALPKIETGRNLCRVLEFADLPPPEHKSLRCNKLEFWSSAFSCETRFRVPILRRFETPIRRRP